MQIDEKEIPKELHQYYLGALASLPDESIHIASQKLKPLLHGLNQKKPNLKTVLERINGILESKTIPIPIQDLLREATLSEKFFAALSIRAIEYGGDDWITYFGKEPYLGSLLLDERKEVRQLAWVKHSQFAKNGENTSNILNDSKELITKFRPFIETIRSLVDGIDIKTPPVSIPATHQNTQITELELQNLISNSKIVKVLRRELVTEKTEHQKTVIELQKLQTNNETLNGDLTSNKNELSELKKDYANKIAKGISDALLLRLGKWIEPTESLAKLIKPAESVIQQAKQALERQAKTDLRYKTVSLLQTDLSEAISLKEMLKKAQAESLHVIPEINISLTSIEQEIHKINSILNKGSIAPESARIAEISHKLNSLTKIEQLQNLKKLITAKIEIENWTKLESSQTYELIDRKMMSLYTDEAKENAFKADDLNRNTPINLLRQSILLAEPCYIFIDGHNFLHKIKNFIDAKYFDLQSGPNKLARSLIIEKLRDLVVSQPSMHCELWFDGPVDTNWTAIDGLKVLFSGGTGENRADARIIESLNSLIFRGVKGSIIVVSDDNAIRNESKKLKGIGISPLEFWTGFLA